MNKTIIDLTDETNNIEFLQAKLKKETDAALRAKIDKQIELLRDAVVIYKINKEQS